MGTVTKDFTFSTGATISASEHNSNFDTLYTLVNGNIDNDNISGSASIANSKLANPNSYFTITICKDGPFTSTMDPMATFIMPFAATLVEASVSAINIVVGGGSNSYTMDLEENGTTVLSSPITMVDNGVPVVGTISDTGIANNSQMDLVLTMSGPSTSVDDITVLLTFKVGHVS